MSPEALGPSRPVFSFRAINLRNPVLQQVLERKSEVLCVLTQRIVTTQPCVISEHIQIEEKCGGMVGIQTKTVQVCVPGAGTGSMGSAASRGPVLAAGGRGLFRWCLHLPGLFCSELTEIQLKLAYTRNNLGLM